MNQSCLKPLSIEFEKCKEWNEKSFKKPYISLRRVLKRVFKQLWYD